MGYELQIRRDSGIPIGEWKQAVSSIPGIRLDDAPTSITNPKTGQTVSIGGSDGDVAVLMDGEWKRVFHYFEGAISFKSGPVSLQDSDDPVARAAFALAKKLSAKLVGDNGEQYG